MRTLSKTKRFIALPTFLAGFALCALSPASAMAVEDEDEGNGDEEEDEAEEVELEHWFVVSGGDVHSGNGEVLRGATVLAKDGTIVEVGYDLQIPGTDYWADIEEDDRWFDVEHLDATGYRIYPGLVAISSSNLVGTTGNFEDQVDPFSSNMLLGLASGITTTGQGSSAIKLKRYMRHDPPRPYGFDEIVLSPKTYVSLSAGSASSRRSLRDKFKAASAYLRKYRQWEEDVKKDKELKEPSKKGVDSSTLSVLRGEVMPRFRANEREDLLWIARIAQEFGFRPQIEGCREGWTVADELGRAGVHAIVTPRDRRDKSEELLRDGGSSIENAGILYKAGVTIAIRPAGTGINLGGIVGRDIMHLPVEVGFAIRGGLPEDAGLASITTVPARMMGVSHRVGTIEEGKDCDLLVTDGDVLHYQTFVQWAVVDGELVYDKENELFFAHIRPRPEAEIAPEVKLDAGENPPEEHEEEGEADDGDDDDGDDDGDDDDDE